jgi:hypothetical protein
MHALDEGAHRLASRVPHADHAAIDARRDRVDATSHGVPQQRVQLPCALLAVDVRIFLEADDEVGRRPHLLREMGMQVEFDAELTSSGAMP